MGGCLAAQNSSGLAPYGSSLTYVQKYTPQAFITCIPRLLRMHKSLILYAISSNLLSKVTLPPRESASDPDEHRPHPPTLCTSLLRVPTTWSIMVLQAPSSAPRRASIARQPCQPRPSLPRAIDAGWPASPGGSRPSPLAPKFKRLPLGNCWALGDNNFDAKVRMEVGRACPLVWNPLPGTRLMGSLFEFVPLTPPP